MKKVFILLLLVLTSCSSCAYMVRPSRPAVTPEGIDCEKVQPVWWGEAGQDPSKNDVWKCYRWILLSQSE